MFLMLGAATAALLVRRAVTAALGPELTPVAIQAEPVDRIVDDKHDVAAAAAIAARA